MSNVRRAAAVASAGAGMLVAGVGLLAAQALQTKRRIPRQGVPPYADGRYGSGVGTSIRLAVLGDSGAAGLGSHDRDQTMGAIIADGVSNSLNRRVVLQNHAVVGAVTADLDRQIDRALWSSPHITVIFIGANDVTHLVPRFRSARLLGDAVRRLRDAGSQVVVGTCPDFAAVQPIPQPLRGLLARRGRLLADAQKQATNEAGGHAVLLGALLGSDFASAPEVYFSADRFHPSADGYSAAAELLLPAVLSALGCDDPPRAAIASGP